MSYSTLLQMPYMAAAQAQKHITHNEALERLDAVVQLVVQSFSETQPPAAPEEGQIWCIGLGGVNEWATHDGELAVWANGGWLFIVPHAGWRAVQGTELRVFDGAAWVFPDRGELQNLAGVGINTSYDATNKLAVAADATLLSHGGSDHQLKINKATAADTASLVFQTGYSGRAEMGTAGSDTFEIKVSADGVNWSSALRVDSATGALTLDAPLSPESGGVGVANPAGATLARVGDHALTLTTTAASSLDLPTSGTVATLAGAETFSNKVLLNPQVDGTVTGDGVTQSHDDVTTGRLTKVGDFGVGENHIPPTLNDEVALSSLPAGFWRNGTGASAFSSAFGGIPAGVVLLGSFNHNSSRALLLCYDDVFVLRSEGASNSSERVFAQQNILGPVSQSAGVPTGKLIERSSNGNGDYVRFADGTQICTHELTTSAGAGENWTFPAAFVAAPTVSGSCVAGVLSAVTQDAAPSSGSTTLSARDASNTRRADVVHVIAVGRWF